MDMFQTWNDTSMDPRQVKKSMVSGGMYKINKWIITTFQEERIGKKYKEIWNQLEKM